MWFTHLQNKLVNDYFHSDSSIFDMLFVYLILRLFRKFFNIPFLDHKKHFSIAA